MDHEPVEKSVILLPEQLQRIKALKNILMTSRAHTQAILLLAVQEGPDGGYAAKAPGCVFCTQTENMDALLTIFKEAIQCRFEEGNSLIG